jgi:hypothetical protein
VRTSGAFFVAETNLLADRADGVPYPSKTSAPRSLQMISSALYHLFGMVQISSVDFLPLSIWTQYFGLGQPGDTDAELVGRL